MGKYAQLVIGPAGSGKSTYCYNMHAHFQAINRAVHLVNLDPAAEEFNYPASVDITDLISLEEVMTEMNLGPNGGLMFCMEYFEAHLQEWLADALEGYGDDDYLMFDCPGQIELYSNSGVFRTFVDALRDDGWSVCCVYCLDSNFVSDPHKLIAGCFQALAAMVQLELPHVNVLTKCDMVADRDALEDFRFPDGGAMAAALQESMPPAFKRLNASVGWLLDDFGMVAFQTLDPTDEDSLEELQRHIDVAIQYGEDEEVKAQDEQAPSDDDEERWGEDGP